MSGTAFNVNCLKSSYLGKRLQWEIYVHNYWEQHLYWKDGSRGRSWFVNTLQWRPQATPIGALDLEFPFNVNLNIGKGACFCTVFDHSLKVRCPWAKLWQRVRCRRGLRYEPWAANTLSSWEMKCLAPDAGMWPCSKPFLEELFQFLTL